jgi:hypothetical protein
MGGIIGGVLSGLFLLLVVGAVALVVWKRERVEACLKREGGFSCAGGGDGSCLDRLRSFFGCGVPPTPEPVVVEEAPPEDSFIVNKIFISVFGGGNNTTATVRK